jgi:glucose-1-phosphatase
MMADKIAGVLFDIGGVLVALDGVPSMAALLGLEAHHETLHALWMSSPSVLAHETGRIGAAEFAAGVVADLELPVTADVFLRDFCSWPKGLLPGALELLEDIPRSYRVAALSNTSAVHWDSILAMGLERRFEQTYLSHRIGHMKPANEAFSIALAGMGLSPSEVIFLDDGQRNVDAATSHGLHAHLVKGPQEARTVLEQYGVVPLRDARS